MKHKRYVAIILAATLTLALAATALALGLSRSAHATAVKAAREAVFEQYGFTPETFGVFACWNQERNDQIVFEPQEYAEQLGTYTVDIKPGEKPVVHWSHEGVDLTELATRGLDSPVWGPAQVERALALKKELNVKSSEMQQALGNRDNWTLEDWAKSDETSMQAGDSTALYFQHILPTEGDIQPEQAIALAKEAIQKKYGVAKEELDSYQKQMEFVRYQDEAEPSYRITLLRGTNASGEVQSYCTVKISSPSGTVTECFWFVDPELRTLPEGPLGDYREAVEEFVRGGAFAMLPAAQKVEVAKRITDAGFGDLLENVEYVPLDAADITQEVATQAANKALIAYGFTDQTLALFDATVSLRKEGDGKVWTMTLKPNQERISSIDPPDGARGDTLILQRMGEYTVDISARDGSANPVAWSLAEQADGKVYTEHNWGVAPAIPVQTLPFIIALNERYHAIYDPYMQREGKWSPMTAAESAAMHGLFRDAGFDAKIVPDSMPGPGEISQEKAKEIAIQALQEEYGVTKEKLDECAWFLEFSIFDPEQPQWWVGPQNLDGWYSVVMDGKTGEVLSVDYTTGGNG